MIVSRVSHSEVESYLLCRRKHWYGYGMSLQPKVTASALTMGTAGHCVLEEFYAYLLSQGGTNAEQLAAFEDGLIVAEAVYQKLVNEGYEDDPKKALLHDTLFTWYFPNEPMVKQGWTVLSVEDEFVLEYDNVSNPDDPKQYPFKIDVVMRDPNGKVVVVDHKFVGEFTSYEDSELQPQIPKYIGALRALNHQIHYGAYNQLRTRKIVGTKSKAHPNGIGPTLDQALLFMPIKPSGTRVAQVFNEQIAVADEIQYRKTLPLDTQNALSFRVANKMVCRMCNFKDLCTAELTGGNSKLLIQTEYQVRERKQFALEATEDAE